MIVTMTLTVSQQVLLDANDNSLADQVRQMGRVFTENLIGGMSIDVAAGRFRRGLESAIEAHGKMAEIIKAAFAKQGQTT